MDALFRLIDNVKNLNQTKIYNSIIRENETFILNLNREQMYEYGIMDVDNEASQLEYKAFTKQAKTGQIQGIPKAKFPRIDHITLKWDGQFHDSLKMFVNDELFLIYSNNVIWQVDLKTQKRFANALGLTESSINKLIDLVLPLYIEKTLNEILK